MKNFILLLSFMMMAGMASSQFRVSSDGVNHALNSEMIVGENAGSSFAKIKVGALRTSSGSAGFDFHSSSSLIPELQLAVSPDGRSIFSHTGNNAMIFAVRNNQSIFFRTNDIVRMRITEAGEVRMSGSATVNGGIAVTSDARLKRSVKSLGLGLKELMLVNPVSYKYNGLGNTSAADRTYVGVIAQELQKIAPNFVSDHVIISNNENGEVVKEETFLKVHDSEIKYWIIQAVKDQQEIIESLKEKISQLESTITNVKEINADKVDLSDVAVNSLNQNSPNPYNEETIIEYSVAKNATSASMKFYNLQGRLIKTVNLQNGDGKLTVSGDELPSGTYTYSLEVDGALITNKKMVKMR